MERNIGADEAIGLVDADVQNLRHSYQLNLERWSSVHGELFRERPELRREVQYRTLRHALQLGADLRDLEVRVGLPHIRELLRKVVLVLVKNRSTRDNGRRLDIRVVGRVRVVAPVHTNSS